MREDDRKRKNPVAGTDEGVDEPDTIDLGRRDFAGTNIANDEYQQAESDRASELTRDNGFIGGDEQEGEGKRKR
jgi:hypothetical protein